MKTTTTNSPDVKNAIRGWVLIDESYQLITEYEPTAGNAGNENPVGTSLRNADKL